MKKALITGINGFVGPHLKQLLEEKGVEVYGLDRNEKHCDEVKVFRADILELETLKAVIKKTEPDIIFHLAGQSSPHKSFEFPDLTFEINVQGTKNLYDAIESEMKVMPKVIVVSSGHVYGKPLATPIDEFESLKPNNPYAESRIEQENFVLNQQKIPTVVMRAFNHIGPGQTEDFVVSAFAKQIVEIKKGLKDPVIKTGNLDAVRDFSDVRDIVNGYYLAALKGTPGEIYNIGGGKGYPIKNILSMLIKIAGVTVTQELDPERLRPSDIKKLICDHHKFTNDTGWHPEYTTEASLSDILHWWEQKIA